MAGDTSSIGFSEYIVNVNATSFATEQARKEALALARSLCHRLEKPMETMIRVAWVEPSYNACLEIALDIGLFEELQKGGKGQSHSAASLASSTNTEAALLMRVLRLLASMNTIDEVGEGMFSATEISNALLERRINSAIGIRRLLLEPVYRHLPAFLKARNYENPISLSDSPWQSAFHTKLSFFDWLGQNPDAFETFTSHMAGYTSQRGTWEEIYPIKERLLDGRRDQDGEDIILVDLGGGAGHDLKRFASGFLPARQTPCLVLQDLPQVINTAKSSGTLPPSVRAVPIDFTKEPPVSGARAYYMHSVLHDWPDADVLAILKQMSTTLSQKTARGRTPKLLLNENILFSKGVQPHPAALDVMMMAIFASHERSEDQWRRLLDSAGYKITGIFWAPSVDEAIIEAEVVVV